MFLEGVFRLKRFLPPTRRERELEAKLADARTSLAGLAKALHVLSALEDARTHQTIKAARGCSSDAAEGLAWDPAAAAFQGTVTIPVDVIVARARGMAKVLDRVTETLEGLVVSLRDG